VANCRIGMDDLALQVGQINHVIIDNPDMPDPRRRQIKRHWRPQPPRTHNQHAGSFETQLPSHPHFGQANMAGIALLFVGS
jgi:hypothetical protein